MGKLRKTKYDRVCMHVLIQTCIYLAIHRMTILDLTCVTRFTADYKNCNILENIR